MTKPDHNSAFVVLAGVVILLFAISVLMQRKVEALRADVRPQEVLYIPSAKTLKRMSLGYTGLMADIYWTRAVQYFGTKHSRRAADYRLLYPLLEITTELDPHLLVAYEFGGIFLAQNPPNGAGQPDKAVEFLEDGIKHNPDYWRLYYQLGFLHVIERRDYLSAAQAFERGSQVPGAHPWLKVLAATMAQHGGDLATARMLWQLTYETTEDKMVKTNAIRHLMALQVDETVPKLEAAVSEFRSRFGRLPAGFGELVSTGYLPRIPRDPIGDPYKLTSDGRVEVQDPEALPFINKGLPPDYKPKMNPLAPLQK